MKGYKAFNSDLKCLDYQYELDKTHVFEGELKLCKSGFHFCTELEDVLKYYLKSDMKVFEIEASGIITEAEEDCSKRACSEIKLIKEIPLDEVALCITKSNKAYSWAIEIGNRDIMIDKILDSKYAYHWAIKIGNQNTMIDKIKDSYWAYRWAMDIGNQDVMIDKIKDSYSAYKWAVDIGNRDIMIDKINYGFDAYLWANDIGNRDIMIDEIDALSVNMWLDKWPEDKQYFIDKGVIL